MPAYRMIPGRLRDQRAFSLRFGELGGCSFRRSFARYGPPYARDIGNRSSTRRPYSIAADSAARVCSPTIRAPCPNFGRRSDQRSLTDHAGHDAGGVQQDPHETRRPWECFMVKAPWGPLLMSAEVAAPEAWVGGARQIRRASAVRDRHAGHALRPAVLQAVRDVPGDVEDAAPHAVPTESACPRR